MRSGMFDREITIERPTNTQDSTYGTNQTTWVPLAYAPGSPAVAQRFPAQIQDVLPSRDESVQQGLNIGRRATRCRLRWRNDVDSSMRVTVHGDSDQVYRIIGGPAEVGDRKEMIELMLERTTT